VFNAFGPTLNRTISFWPSAPLGAQASTNILSISKQEKTWEFPI
jgi:hypothetical protein